MNETVRNAVNAVAGVFGVRVVNRRWGPRGAFAALKRARNAGVAVRQIVDAGASDGIWTREALTIFPDAAYFMVDALEKNRARLEALTRENGRCNSWIGALGPGSGTQEIFEAGDQSSFFGSTTFPAKSKARVEMRTLDSFLDARQIAPPDLIKADVQGFELEILKGAQKCLAHAELLLLEVSFRQLYERAPLAHEVIAWAGERGFRIYDISTYSQRPRDGELAQADVLFASKRSKLFEFEGWA